MRGDISRASAKDHHGDQRAGRIQGKPLLRPRTCQVMTFPINKEGMGETETERRCLPPRKKLPWVDGRMKGQNQSYEESASHFL